MADFNENVKYVFKTPYVTDHGVLHENSEIRILRGAVYFDGGMVPESYAKELLDIVESPVLREKYLKEVHLIKDVIA